MSTQLRMEDALVGANQEMLDDYIKRVNTEAWGIDGTAWDGAAPLGPFDGNLVGQVTVRDIAQWLDDADLGGTDTNFTTGSLTRAAGAGSVTHQFNDNNLTIASTAAFGHSGSVMQWNASAVMYYTAGTLMSFNTPWVEFRGGAVTSAPPELRLYEAADDGSNYVSLISPAVQSNYFLTLPDIGPTGAKVLASSATSNSATARLEWIDVPDTNFTTGSLTRVAAAGAVTHEFNDNDMTIQGTGDLGLLFGNADLQGATVGVSSSTVELRGIASTEKTELRFFEKADNGTNYFGFRAPDSISSTVAYTFPATGPASNGQVLSVLAGGGTSSVSLEWADGGGGGGGYTPNRGVIKLNTAYVAGTQINLDGTSVNQSLLAGSDTITMTGIASQSDLFADKRISFWVDGIRCDLTGDASAHCTAQFVNTGAISLSQDFPAGALLEVQKIE